MRYIDFVDLDYQPRESDLVCKFRVDPGDHPMEFIAGGVAAESSVGTWTELSTEEPYVRERAAKVFSLEGDRFKVAYPLELFEPGNMPNILSSVAGNVFGLEDLRSLRMEDIWFPGELAGSFKGPKYGVEGVRRVTGVEGRPLVGTRLQPLRRPSGPDPGGPGQGRAGNGGEKGLHDQRFS